MNSLRRWPQSACRDGRLLVRSDRCRAGKFADARAVRIAGHDRSSVRAQSRSRPKLAGHSGRCGDAEEIELVLVRRTCGSGMSDDAQIGSRDGEDVAVECDRTDLGVLDRLAAAGVLGRPSTTSRASTPPPTALPVCGMRAASARSSSRRTACPGMRRPSTSRRGGPGRPPDAGRDGRRHHHRPPRWSSGAEVGR